MIIPRTNDRDDWAVYADWLTEQGDARGPAILEVLRRTRENVDAVWLAVAHAVADCRVLGARCPECAPHSPSHHGDWGATSRLTEWLRRRRLAVKRARRKHRRPCASFLSSLRTEHAAPAARYTLAGDFAEWFEMDMRIPF